MTRYALFRVLDGIAVISLNALPVNALCVQLRAALAEHFHRIDTEDQISAVVLRAEGALFSAGADIRELAAAWQGPGPRDLCDLIEGCSKPVVAALGGQALGKPSKKGGAGPLQQQKGSSLIVHLVPSDECVAIPAIEPA